MEKYYITNKELKNAIKEAGYEHYADVWKLLDIILHKRGYTLDRIKNEIIAMGINDRKKIIEVLNYKLQENINGFLTLDGLKRYIGEWHVSEMIKGNIRDPNVERKIILYNKLLTILEKYKKEKEKEEKMLMEFTDFYDEELL